MTFSKAILPYFEIARQIYDGNIAQAIKEYGDFQ